MGLSRPYLQAHRLQDQGNAAYAGCAREAAIRQMVDMLQAHDIEWCWVMMNHALCSQWATGCPACPAGL